MQENLTRQAAAIKQKIEPLYITAPEIMALCGVGQSNAYNIIRKCNDYITEHGGLVAIKGKTNRRIFFKLVALQGEGVSI